MIARARLGLGLFAIHDDEDAAEVMGVPTYRYKLVAFGVSCALAGVAGGIQALFVSYVTANGTFNITVPLTVVLMSVLGGTRHWAGPAIGATAITLLLYASTAADQAVDGKAVVGAILVAAVLFMPKGILGRALRSDAARGATRHASAAGAATASGAAADRRCVGPCPSNRRGAQAATGRVPMLTVRGLRKSFEGVHALDGVDLDVREGEILGVLGPNGSGKSTLINVVSGHYRAEAGSARFAGRDLLATARAPDRACRHCAHLPDPPAVRASDGARQRRAGRDVRRRGARPACARHEAARTWLRFTGLAARATRCRATSTCTRRSSSSSRARSPRSRGS